MSVSPAQNFLKPPPVPEMPTVTRTPRFSIWNSSATASVTGKTVLEPSIRTMPDKAASFSIRLSPLPQAAAAAISPERATLPLIFVSELLMIARPLLR